MSEESHFALELRYGNHLSFACIYKKYAQQAYMLAFKYLGNKELAEDAVQNLFLKLWDMREDIDTTRPINHLLFRMLRNQLLNVLRDSRNELFIIDDCLETLNIIDGIDEEPDITQYQLEIFKKAILQLSPQRRKIFTLKISGKYTNFEIAEKLHLSVNTIKFQYSQSLKLVRQYTREIAMSALIAASSISLLS